MTSRSRRSRTRGPPSAPRMGFLPVGAPRRPYDLQEKFAREWTPALSLEAGAVLRLLYFRAVTHVYNQTKSADPDPSGPVHILNAKSVPQARYRRRRSGSRA